MANGKPALRAVGRRQAHGSIELCIRRSLVGGRVRTLDFDIDLAIEGGDLLQAWRIADESSYEVDVVDLDDVSPAFRAAVEKRGEVLYERTRSHA